MIQSVDIATQNILDTCACIANRLGGTVLVVASNPGLGEPLLERLQLTQGIQGILIPDKVDATHIASEMDCSTGFSLVLVQPVKSDLDFLSSLLRHLKMHLVIVLEASWMGRRILPSWNILPKRSLATSPEVYRLLQPELGWRQQRFSVGNLSCLWWGFLGGRSQAFGRPDLADRSFAHMRRHLSISSNRHGLVYLSLHLVSRENLGTPALENTSGTYY